MPTITGTLLRGNGEALQTTLRFWKPAIGVQGAAVVAAEVLIVSTGEDGTFSTTLASGAWVVTWPKGVGGNPISRLNLTIPSEDGTYSWTDLIDEESIAASAGIRWFTDIAAMLAAPAREWAEGRTLNSYGSDGIRSGWDRLLKTSPAASGMEDNTDSILETDDGLAFAVRSWIAG